MSKSKQIFIEDRSKKEEIPIHFQEDYELESAYIQYYRDIEMEYEFYSMSVGAIN